MISNGVHFLHCVTRMELSVAGSEESLTVSSDQLEYHWSHIGKQTVVQKVPYTK